VRRVRIASTPIFLANTINYTILTLTLTLIDISTYLPNICDYDIAPNENDDLPTCMRKAKDFLQEYPKEQLVTVARIYKVHCTTLSSTINRPQPHNQHGGHNKILQGP
jgi:hypothetical protein